MMNFRILPGLPPYGPSAIGFPPQWGAGARKGLVVEFTADTGDVWVGNFQPGISGLDDVLGHPNGRHVLVASNGTLWAVNPTTRVADRVAVAVIEQWRVSEPEGYVLNNQGLGFIRIGPAGVLWNSRRLSWDGFSDVKLEGEHLTGRAWTPIDDAWMPFTLDLRTGTAEGGSYNGPDMELGV